MIAACGNFSSRRIARGLLFWTAARTLAFQSKNSLYSNPFGGIRSSSSRPSTTVRHLQISAHDAVGSSNTLSPLAVSVQESIQQVSFLQSSMDDFVLTLSVSGGCDSIALLHACMECSFHSTYLQVVHFNHQQRDAESDADASFVQQLCDMYRIPCKVELWQDANLSTFSQDTARQWRRQRLLQLTQQAMAEISTGSVGVVLTAHHREDSLESLILKALRGVHLLNLVGMNQITPLAQSVFLVRPWVHEFSKQDLIDYLQLENRPWREDKSNTSSKYMRNRVRNELFPLLHDMTDGTFLETRIPTWIQQSQELDNDLQPRVQALGTRVVDGDIFQWERSCQLVESDNLSVTSLVQSQTLYQWITKSSLDISYETFQRVVDQLRKFPQRQEWIMELGQGWSVQRKGAILRILKPTSNTAKNDKPVVWTWSIVSKDNLITVRDNTKGKLLNPFSKKEIILWVSADWISQNVNAYQTTVAAYSKDTKSKGLTFRPPWKSSSSSSSSVKLRQFLRGQGIPLHQRDDTPLLVVDDCIIAVQIRTENRCEWIVHGDYSSSEEVLPHECTAKVLIRLVGPDHYG